MQGIVWHGMACIAYGHMNASMHMHAYKLILWLTLTIKEYINNILHMIRIILESIKYSWMHIFGSKREKKDEKEKKKKIILNVKNSSKYRQVAATTTINTYLSAHTFYGSC